VHWRRQYRGATVYGEVDFIVVNRAGDALLIEQKNGPLEEDDAGLHKRYGEADRVRHRAAVQGAAGGGGAGGRGSAGEANAGGVAGVVLRDDEGDGEVGGGGGVRKS
jgi:hypothetical protein